MILSRADFEGRGNIFLTLYLSERVCFLRLFFNSEPCLTQDKDEGALSLSLFVYKNLVIHSQMQPYSQVRRLVSFFAAQGSINWF